MKKLKPKKTSKALAVKKNLAWGGVMSSSNSQQEVAIRQLCQKVAQIYGIPPLGINVLGSQPYLNKEGRLYLLSDIRKGKEALKGIKTEFIQFSTKPSEVSICKKTLIFQNGVEIEGIGEASQENVKLEAVKKTLNMMAETRALNRVIWQAIAGDVWKRVEKNLGKYNSSEQEKEMVFEAGKVSYEEVADNRKSQAATTALSNAGNTKVTDEEANEILMLAVNAGFPSKKKVIEGVNRLLKINVRELSDLTKSQAGDVKVALLSKQAENKR